MTLNGKEGFTIVSLLGMKKDDELLFRAHGWFKTKGEAQDYIDSGAALRIQDGNYRPISELLHRIMPLSEQG